MRTGLFVPAFISQKDDLRAEWHAAAIVGVAGDDPRAVDVVAELIERIGYDAVRFDRLSAGRLLEPGVPVFGASLHRTEFELAVRAEAA